MTRLRLLWYLWRLNRRYPTLRFGQMMVNMVGVNPTMVGDSPCFNGYCDSQEVCRQLHYISDKLMITRVKVLLQRARWYTHH